MVGAGGEARLCKKIVEVGRELKCNLVLSEAFHREIDGAFEAANKTYLAAGKDAIRAIGLYNHLRRKSDILDGFLAYKAERPNITWDAFINRFYSPVHIQKLKSFIEKELKIKVLDEDEFSAEQIGRIEQLCEKLIQKRAAKRDASRLDTDGQSRDYTLRTNEAKQMAMVYEARRGLKESHQQHWFVTFDEFVYKASVELAQSGDDFFRFPCYMKPARWLEILTEASPKPLDLNIFREILISAEISRAADYVESQVIAQMLQARVDDSVQDVEILRYMFTDIVNRPAVQDAYSEVLRARGTADKLASTEKVKDKVIEALRDKLVSIEDKLKLIETELNNTSIRKAKAEGKAKYLKRELTKARKRAPRLLKKVKRRRA